MNNLMTLVKLDGRYALSKHFTHRVEFGYSWKHPTFLRYWKLVKALTEAHGAGMPLQVIEHAIARKEPITIWAHGIMSSGDAVIYLRDASLTDFILLKERYEDSILLDG